MRSQRDSCGLVQPVSGSGDKEICPICTRETEWAARLTGLIDATAQETCSGCAPQESAVVSLSPSCRLLGLMVMHRNPWGISNTKAETQLDHHNT